MNSKHYAVIFSNTLANTGDEQYYVFSNQMLEEVKKISGFLGVESYREKDGRGVTISYWENMEAIEQWKNNDQHKKAQKYGNEVAYLEYELKVCEVQR